MKNIVRFDDSIQALLFQEKEYDELVSNRVGNKPMLVICSVGITRCGKSTTLNILKRELLGEIDAKSPEFEAKSNAMPITKDINAIFIPYENICDCYKEKIKKNNEEFDIMIIDTEGQQGDRPKEILLNIYFIALVIANSFILIIRRYCDREVRELFNLAFKRFEEINMKKSKLPFLNLLIKDLEDTSDSQRFLVIQDILKDKMISNKIQLFIGSQQYALTLLTNPECNSAGISLPYNQNSTYYYSHKTLVDSALSCRKYGMPKTAESLKSYFKNCVNFINSNKFNQILSLENANFIIIMQNLLRTDLDEKKEELNKASRELDLIGFTEFSRNLSENALNLLIEKFKKLDIPANMLHRYDNEFKGSLNNLVLEYSERNHQIVENSCSNCCKKTCEACCLKISDGIKDCCSKTGECCAALGKCCAKCGSDCCECIGSCCKASCKALYCCVTCDECRPCEGCCRGGCCNECCCCDNRTLTECCGPFIGAFLAISLFLVIC